MRGKFVVLLICFNLLFGFQQVQKQDYDIQGPALNKVSDGTSFEYLLCDNEKLEISLANGGYFTIGTQKGVSNSSLDNNCDITFGHPFAKTSYPMIAINGTWYPVDDFFGDFNFVEEDQGLKIVNAISENIAFDFSISLENNEISIKSALTNLGTETHQLGAGMVIDPALGKWNDAALAGENGFITNAGILENLAEMNLWEKATGAKGLGISIESEGQNFAKIIADNWHFAYNNHVAELSDATVSELFDIILKCYWPEKSLNPGDSLVNTMTITLTEPDFSSSVFMRWDVPNFLDMNNGAMFPRQWTSYLELVKNSETADDNGNLTLELPDHISADAEAMVVNFNGQQSVFQPVSLNSNISYDDMVVILNAAYSDTELIDELSRNLYIPATPVNDSGLVIYGDSLITSGYPEISLIFNAENKETGRKILDLKKENILLYENETTVEEFEFGYFESEGSNEADIVFVLDCSGSMGDEIDAVRDNINAFGEELAEKGYDYKIGVITFSTTVDDVWDFTDDLETIKANLNSVGLWGGTEDSPSALMAATELSWRTRSKKSIVWITDEAYPEYKYTAEQVVETMLSIGITVNGVGLNELQTDWFNPIVNPTGGNFYDINGDFRTILLDVANMGSEFKYQVSYATLYPSNEQNQIYLKLRYQGLGGHKIFDYNTNDQSESNMELFTFYPNPFNERINFNLNIGKLRNINMTVYNILGNKVRELNVHQKLDYQKVYWNGKDWLGRDVGTGLYIIQFSGVNPAGDTVMKTGKMLYLK